MLSPDEYERWGIRDRSTALRSPWQNGHVERLIGSIRRESLDHLVVFDEAQLRRVLKNYASYYNHVRTHLSLDTRMRRIFGARRSSAQSQLSQFWVGCITNMSGVRF
jgi:transposase InsO family protein